MTTDTPIYNSGRGTWLYRQTSKFQYRASIIEVRLPTGYDPVHCYPVVYLLPCEAGEGHQFGDPIIELLMLSADLTNRAIFVRPTFDTLPWYAHHACDTHIRHDAYLMTEVIPLVESQFATSGAKGRLLLGFSKSGWGAFSLIARYPDYFKAAASWDAPLLMDEACFGAYGTAGHFGTSTHFAGYCPPVLFRGNPQPFRQLTRIVLAGQQLFGAECMPSGEGECHTACMHQLFTELGITHHFHNDLIFPHRWHAGWMEPELQQLLAIAENA